MQNFLIQPLTMIYPKNNPSYTRGCPQLLQTASFLHKDYILYTISSAVALILSIFLIDFQIRHIIISMQCVAQSVLFIINLFLHILTTPFLCISFCSFLSVHFVLHFVLLPIVCGHLFFSALLFLLFRFKFRLHSDIVLHQLIYHIFSQHA